MTFSIDIGLIVQIISDIILAATAIFIAWQALETRRLVVLTRVKDQPLLEIVFNNKGAEVELRNLGASPAYSPAISRLTVSNEEYFEFDPLHYSRLPIMANESRRIWMNHKKVENGQIRSFVESIPSLKKAFSREKTKFLIELSYYDKDGKKLCRNLYIKKSGHPLLYDDDSIVYATTSQE